MEHTEFSSSDLLKENRWIKWEELSISNDFLFGKVMQNPELCKELLQRILPDLNIERIEYPELQKSINMDMDARSVRLEEAVKEAKKNREWRHEYMTLLMRDQENVKIGEEKMLLLMERLIEDRRFDDIARIKADNGYRQKLYLEYHII